MQLRHFLLLSIWQLSHCPEYFALDKLPPNLNQEFVGKNSISVMLTMEDSVDKVFNSIKAHRFANSDERTTAMVAELQAHTASSQKHVMDHLSRKSSLGKVTSFWITNKISIEAATKASLQELLDLYGSSIKDVRTIRFIYPLPLLNKDLKDNYDNYDNLESTIGFSGSRQGQGAFKPGNRDKHSGEGKSGDGFKPGHANVGSPIDLAGPGINPLPGGGPVDPTHESIMENWGVPNIGADIAHQAGYDGRGKVVGIIDSGARWTHEVLRNSMRPTYNWFDTVNGTHYSKPVDHLGHGKHCAGIASGGLGIGVAPGSQWISCRIFYNDGATEIVMLLCGQWMLCPTLVDGSKPDCSMRPDVVSNSWGSPFAIQMDPYYDDVIAAWHLADITPVFSAGNSGPGCKTGQSPADSIRGVIAVGCTNINNFLSPFSSLGPTYEVKARIKPDLCAPGRKISSASYIADNQYLVESGTSMSSPHVAGAVVVYKQKYPDATFTQILQAFQSSAYQWRMSDDACNYKSTNMTVKWPNNYCGHGIIRLNAALGLPGRPVQGSGRNN